MLCCPIGAEGHEPEGGEIDDEAREEDAVFSEPVVGYEHKPKEDGLKALPSPKELTPAQLAETTIKHLPHCDGCPYCTAGRRANSPHSVVSNTKRISVDGR